MPAAKRSRVFTHKEVIALKCKAGKPYTDIAEGGGRDGGFGVRVYASGRKVFHYKFRSDGKLKYMSLGEFADSKGSTEEQKVSLEKAHRAYQEARAEVVGVVGTT